MFTPQMGKLFWQYLCRTTSDFVTHMDHVVLHCKGCEISEVK
jgi:hypothetical protein